MIRLFTTLLVLVLCSVSLASNSKVSAQKVLEQMTLTYSQVAYMKSEFNKEEISTLLGTTEKSKGSLEYSRKKIRVETKGKDKKLFIKGDKKFWYVSAKNEVMTGLVSKSVPNIFEAIFSDPNIWSKLGTSYVSVPSKTAEIKIDPKGKIPNVTEMFLTIDLVKRTVLKLTYVDEINNKTNVQFKNSRFFNSPKPKRFLYKIKSKDKVSEV